MDLQEKHKEVCKLLVDLEPTFVYNKTAVKTREKVAKYLIRTNPAMNIEEAAKIINQIDRAGFWDKLKDSNHSVAVEVLTRMYESKIAKHKQKPIEKGQ